MMVSDRGQQAGLRKFVPPKDIEEAESRRATAAEEVSRIQAQLSDKNRLGPDGRRISERDYHEWRARAIFALGALQGELRQLNVWIRNRNRAVSAKLSEAVGLGPQSSTLDHLVAAHQLLKRLATEVDLEPEEQATVDMVSQYLEKIL